MLGLINFFEVILKVEVGSIFWNRYILVLYYIIVRNNYRKYLFNYYGLLVYYFIVCSKGRFKINFVGSYIESILVIYWVF